MTETVLLFDIDGTLLLPARGRGYRREIKRGLEMIFGTAGRIDEVSFAGKTDLAILREALEDYGVGPAEIRARLGAWQTLFIEMTEQLGRDLPLFVACSGVPDLVARLDRDPRFALSNLTGKHEPKA
jgi:FMN phosphatase YigB (HAD superfamily)